MRPELISENASCKIKEDYWNRAIRDSIKDGQFECADIVLFKCRKVEGSHRHYNHCIGEEVISTLDCAKSDKALQTSRESITAMVENEA